MTAMNQKEHDIVKVNINKLLLAIDNLKKYCLEEMKQNNMEHANNLNQLKNEAWIGVDNIKFLEMNQKLLENMQVIERFYDNIIHQLEKIRDDMSSQMQEKINIHTF